MRNKFLIILLIFIGLSSCAFYDELKGLAFYDDSHRVLKNYFATVTDEQFLAAEDITAKTETSRTFVFNITDPLTGNYANYTGAVKFVYWVTQNKKNETVKFCDVDVDFDVAVKKESSSASVKKVVLDLTTSDNGLINDGITYVYMDTTVTAPNYTDFANMRAYWFYPKHSKTFNPYTVEN